MKKIALALLSLALGTSASAAPYLQGLWTKGAPVYVSQGAVFMPSTLAYDRAWTNVAFAYHPLSAGSAVPARFQAIIPPESWACTIGGGYASAQGGASAGLGCGLNLLDSVRGWASLALSKTSNATMLAIGRQIAPGSGPLNLYAGRQYDDTLVTPLRFAPRWFFGASFGF